MPIIESLMAALVKRYGEDEGKRIYFAMEGEGKGPFGEHGRFRAYHEEWAAKNGVPPIVGTKKPRPSK